MKKEKGSLNLSLSIMLLSALSMPMSLTKCENEPPCANTPMSMTSEFYGVLYDPDLGGQMYADWSSLCININDKVIYCSDLSDVQTVIIEEEYQQEEFYFIFSANFAEATSWDGGSEVIVRVSSAKESAKNKTPIAMDGIDAVGFYWIDGYWKTNENPDYITQSGELYFTSVTELPGSTIVGEYSSLLTTYTAGSVMHYLPLETRSILLDYMK